MSDTDARATRLALELVPGTDALALPDGFHDRAEAYVRLLLTANARLNLTRVVEPEAVARLHLLDALSALPLLDAMAPRRALDLGSGGGVPGIVLALARPGIAWTLVDSERRKADALRSFVDALGLAHVEVVAERAETLGRDPAHRASFDVVGARACAALPVLVEYALPLLRTGGSLLAWKGAIDAEEIGAGRAAASALGGSAPVTHPAGFATLGDHRFVVVRKEHATPDEYPRRPGQARRRPLG
ncbi:MAG TPA: 16S rRNA (guanine(527)-N(7))-methyltransferase RsmG [Candidatus Binatia bacterium]|nr:16S rRNA (guanine(527)-N(7))-methyltransferase RsmG [Candidatus Binatia bacterium]